MKQRPLIIKIIAFAYVLNPLFFIGQYFFFSETAITDPVTWQSLLTPYKVISFIILPPIVGVGIYLIKTWGWYLFLVHALYILGNNTLAFLVGSRTPPWLTLVFSGVTLGVIGLFVHSYVRAPFFNPRIRWWESKPRYAISLVVDLNNGAKTLSGETYNISEGGMFMVSDAEVNIGEDFSVKLSRDGESVADCKGKVVWVNPAGQKMPQGFGFMFDAVKAENLKGIRTYIQDQKKVLQNKALYR